MDEKGQLQAGEAGAEVPQPGLRFLETAVYIMGGLLVLMLLGLIFGIVWKITHKPPVVPPQTQLLDLGLPAGTQVQHMVLDGDRLAIDTGAEILVVDTRQNLVLSRIVIKAK
jgi:hypothetical protein